jgi:hypothetical protein
VRVEAINSWGHHALSDNAGVALVPEPVPAVPTGPTTRTFEQTGASLSGRFLDFWQTNGGLPVFGYPMGAPDEAQLFSQNLERARFERHRENAAPYGVLLEHIGVEAVQARGQDWHAFPTVPQAPDGCLYFAETGHSCVDDSFSIGLSTAWDSMGNRVTHTRKALPYGASRSASHTKNWARMDNLV